uniref:Ig-like domain-containing protein n=1 Tax=Chrysemys picta bellii TaxID=8478 RepID=A0A8C3HJU7_CHRPI
DPMSLVSLAQLSRSWIQGKKPGYPKPNISLHPSAGVAPGGAVTIRCECRCRGVRVLLSKAGDPDARRSMDPVGDVAEFPIRSVSRRDAGNYSCQYSTKWDPPVWSEPSNPVELVISGEGARLVSLLPAPHPAEPSGRLPVTVRCWGRHQNMRFLLYKVGNPNALQDAEPAGDMAEFPIRNVSRRDAGSYSCRYSTKSDPPVWSELSDPMELVVAGEGPSSAFPRVALGRAVTIRCECRCREARFLLSKAEDPEARRSMDPAGDVAEFPIHSVSRRNAGSYSCQYSIKSNPPIWSEPSDLVELVIAGEGPGSTSLTTSCTPNPSSLAQPQSLHLLLHSIPLSSSTEPPPAPQTPHPSPHPRACTPQPRAHNPSPTPTPTPTPSTSPVKVQKEGGWSEQGWGLREGAGQGYLVLCD